MELVAAVRRRSKKALDLIRSGVDVNVPSARGETALLWAVIHGDDDLVAALLAAGAHPNPRTRGKRGPGNGAAGGTPLHFATNPGRTGILKQLLAAGAVVDAADAVGMTPLGAAASIGNVDAVGPLLAAGAQPDLGCPLLMAARAGHVEVVRALLAAGAQHTPVETLPFPPLRMAIINGHEEVIAVLREVGARWPL